MNNKIEQELKSFNNLWKGGTTLAKHGWEIVSKTRNIDAIYDVCIAPLVGENTNVLEIGCNGGGWTQKMLHANKIIGLDALSAEHTGFWNNIPKNDNIAYHQVKDFECNEISNQNINYVFSYDVFCHISYSGAESYLKNLYPKLNDDTNLFIMIADIDKYTDQNGLKKLLRLSGHTDMGDFINDYDGDAYNGRWYFYGTDRFCHLLSKYKYKLVNKDVMGDLDPLSPTIHFKKEQ